MVSFIMTEEDNMSKLQQKINGEQDKILMVTSKEIGWKIRHLAGKRKMSISNLMAEIVKEYLVGSGFLKEGDEKK